MFENPKHICLHMYRSNHPNLKSEELKSYNFTKILEKYLQRSLIRAKLQA